MSNAGKGGGRGTNKYGIFGRSVALSRVGLTQDAPAFDPEAEDGYGPGFRASDVFDDRAVPAIGIREQPRNIEDWWSEAWATREWGDAEDAGYPFMPDDYTPRMTSGRAVTGHRRTHRRRYTTPDGFEIRMPSATSVKSYALDQQGQSFDIAVSATAENGTPVMTTMRCTWMGPGEWSVVPLAGEHKYGRVAEAVASVLEARRPSVALSGMRDLAAKRKERYAQEGVAPESPSKRSFVSAAGVSADGTTSVTRIGDRVYGHDLSGLPPREIQRIADGLAGKTSSHVGAVFNKDVKGRARVDVTQCPRCGAWTREGSPHKCRVVTARPEGRKQDEAEGYRRSAGTAFLRNLLRRPRPNAGNQGS
jgi:hypothetical protein